MVTFQVCNVILFVIALFSLVLLRGLCLVLFRWRINGGCVALSFRPPFFSLALFIVIMGIYIFIIRLRFKWQIMGVLTKEEYSSVIHELWLFGWNFNAMYNVETSPAFLEILDKVKPFWNDRLEW